MQIPDSSPRTLSVLPTATGAYPTLAEALAAKQSGHFASIAMALDAANPGDIVEVAPGRYEEVLVVDRDVEVRAAPGTVVVSAPGDGPTLQCTGGAARISGLDLERSPAGTGPCVAVTGGNAVLEDCDITSASQACVEVHGHAAAPTLRRCVVRDGADAGVFVHGNASARLEDCRFLRCTNPGVVAADASLDVRACHFEAGKGNGIYVHTSSVANIERCSFVGHGNIALAVGKSASATVIDCTIDGSLREGASVFEGADAILTGCRIRFSKAPGLVVRSGSRATVDTCTFSDGDEAGVLVFEADTSAVLTRCVFAHNRNPAVVVREHAHVSVDDAVFDAAPSNAVYALQHGRAVVRRPTVRRRTLPAFGVSTQGSLEVRDGTVVDGADAALFAFDGGQALFANMTVERCARAGAVVRGAESSATLLDCLFVAGSGDGVRFSDGATGRIEGCTIRGYGARAVVIQTAATPTVERLVTDELSAT